MKACLEFFLWPKAFQSVKIGQVRNGERFKHQARLSDDFLLLAGQMGRRLDPGPGDHGAPPGFSSWNSRAWIGSARPARFHVHQHVGIGFPVGGQRQPALVPHHGR